MVGVNKKVFISSFLVLIVLVVGLYFYSSNNQRPTEITDVVFSPKWVNQAQFAGVYVAKDLGFYEDEGLNVIIDNFQSGDLVLDDIHSGASHLGLTSANEFLIRYSEEPDIRALAAFYQVSPYMVASLKTRSITSPAELKGQTLGIKGGNGAEAQATFSLLLASVGLDLDDVDVVTIPFGTSESQDLLDEKADVIGFYRTRLYQFDKEGLSYNAIYPEQYGAALYNDVLVATQEYVENNPDTIEAFVEATIRGWEYAFKNPEEAIAVTLRYVTDDVYKDIDYERYILSQAKDLMMPSGDTDELGTMDSDHWQKFYDAFIERGLLTNEFDVEEAFTTEFLP